eukprot:8988053-Pyramimonas_sp.AAC.1
MSVVLERSSCRLSSSPFAYVMTRRMPRCSLRSGPRARRAPLKPWPAQRRGPRLVHATLVTSRVMCYVIYVAALTAQSFTDDGAALRAMIPARKYK